MMPILRDDAVMAFSSNVGPAAGAGDALR